MKWNVWCLGEQKVGGGGGSAQWAKFCMVLSFCKEVQEI